MGDAEGNIAWWGAARLVIRPAQLNSFVILDGASGKDEVLGYRDFYENLQSENPKSRILYNGNNQLRDSGSGLESGYYAAEERAHRIGEFFNPAKKSWTADERQSIQLETKNPHINNLWKRFLSAISENSGRSEVFSNAAEVFKNWDGIHKLKAAEPTIFHRLFYHLSLGIFADEIEEKSTLVLLNVSLIDKSIPLLLNNPQSSSWDNLDTSDNRETQVEIFGTA
jgi:penicillin amidase